MPGSRLAAVAGLVVCAVACSAVAPAAAYNGSIVFPLQQGDALYPAEQASVGSARRLDALLTAVRRRGRPMKVAMFTSATDFGSRSELFGHPQQAAEALDDLLHPQPTRDRAPLVVVMPAGLGVRGVSADDQALVRTVPIDIRADADQVVAAAGLAVQALARRDGVAAPIVFKASQATAVRTTPAATAALLAMLFTGAGVLGGLRTRRREQDTEMVRA